LSPPAGMFFAAGWWTRQARRRVLRFRAVVLKLYKHAEPLRSFPSVSQTSFLPNTTESKNGLLKSDDLRRTPETAPSKPRGSIEPSLRTTGLRGKIHFYGGKIFVICLKKIFWAQQNLGGTKMRGGSPLNAPLRLRARAQGLQLC